MPKKDSLLLLGIKHYLQSQSYINGLSVNDKRHIRKRCKDFTFVNGELYFKQRIVCDGVESLRGGTTEYDHLRKVLVRDVDKLRAVTEHHIAENGSHNGFEKTCRGVKMTYYWLGIPAYVRQTLRTCEVCMTRRNDKDKLKDELSKIDTGQGLVEDNSENECERVGYEQDTSFEKYAAVEEFGSTSHFWNTVELKVIGSYEIVQGKCIYVCIVIDTYSRWCEIQVIDDITVTCISKFIFNLICKFGMMKYVYMEDDRVNTTDIIQLLNNTLSTSIEISSTSCLDSLWETMKDEFECFVKNHQEDWYKYLEIFLVPFRWFNIHDNLSAAFLANGREPELPSILTNDGESSSKPIDKLVKIHKLFGQDAVDHISHQKVYNYHNDIHSDIIPSIMEDKHAQTMETETGEPEDIDEDATDYQSKEQAPAQNSDIELKENSPEVPEPNIEREHIESLNEDLTKIDSVACQPQKVTRVPVTRNSRKRKSELCTSSDKSDNNLTSKNRASTEDVKICTSNGEKNFNNDEESPSPRRSRRSQVFNKKENISKYNRQAKLQNLDEKGAVKKEQRVTEKKKAPACDNFASDDDTNDKPPVDTDDDRDYVPEVESNPSPVSNTRRSLRGIKQDWSCLLQKRKFPTKSSLAKKAKTENVQISRKERKSNNSPQKVKRSISKEVDENERNNVSISSLETEEYYNGVKYFLEKQQSSGNVKTNCKAITNFRLENDHLYYQATPKHREKEIIISEEERVRLMARAHVDDEGTHLCKRKVIDCISAMEYYWRGLTLDCEAFVRACPQCNNGDIRKVESEEIKEKDVEKEEEINSDIIKEYLDNKTYPKHYDKKKKTTLRRKAGNYMKKDGFLYYQYKSSDKPRLCLFTSEEKRKAIKDAHIIKDSGQHLGLNKTQDIVKTNYYWIGQTNDVYRYISQCCLVTEKPETESKTTKHGIEDRIDKFTKYFNNGSLDDFIKKKEVVVEDSECNIESPSITEMESITDTLHPPNSSSQEIDQSTDLKSKVEPLPVQGINDEPKQTVDFETLVPVPIKIECEEPNKMIIPATYDASTNTLAFSHPKCSTPARDCKRTSIDVKPNITSSKCTWRECSICKAVFSGKVAYKFHMMRHSGTKPYFCNYCNKGFTSIKAKQLHHRKHTGDQPYLCNICARRFERKEGLKYHLKAHEKGGGVPVICDLCSRSFQTVSRLNVHKACKHPDIKPTFPCHDCHKIFSSKRSLKRHFASTHLQEKNYVCNHCNRGFARKEYLHKHVQNQHCKTADTVGDTQIKIEGDHSAPILQYIDAATLAQLTESGEVTIQSDIVINEADIPVINDNNTVVFTGDTVQYEVECLTSDQAMVADDQAIQLLVQASLQSQQLQIQQQQLELQDVPESLPHDQPFDISQEVSQPQ